MLRRTAGRFEQWPTAWGARHGRRAVCSAVADWSGAGWQREQNNGAKPFRLRRRRRAGWKAHAKSQHTTHQQATHAGPSFPSARLLASFGSTAETKTRRASAERRRAVTVVAVRPPERLPASARACASRLCSRALCLCLSVRLVCCAALRSAVASVSLRVSYVALPPPFVSLWPVSWCGHSDSLQCHCHVRQEGKGRNGRSEMGWGRKVQQRTNLSALVRPLCMRARATVLDVRRWAARSLERPTDSQRSVPDITWLNQCAPTFPLVLACFVQARLLFAVQP
jgi:hypothetical protein